jgi:hypothetical protein
VRVSGRAAARDGDRAEDDGLAVHEGGSEYVPTAGTMIVPPMTLSDDVHPPTLAVHS